MCMNLGRGIMKLVSRISSLRRTLEIFGHKNLFARNEALTFIFFYNVFQPTREHPPSTLRWDEGS
jgi:hypothetical protein